MKILFVSGVPIDRTPVVKYTLEILNEQGWECETVEFLQNKISFILHSFVKLLYREYDVVFFIGLQTLPLLTIFQKTKSEKFYWFLESYKGNENNSFILKMTKFERFINWQKVNAIFPILQRTSLYSERSFKKVIIIPNTSRFGNTFFERKINSMSVIKIVLYGALDDKNVYVREFINFVKHYDNLKLDLYGYMFNLEKEIMDIENIEFKGLIPHDQLIEQLKDYHYSIIGYKPLDFNTKYCAPNKLYEAMSMSLPVILNSNNPTLNLLPESASIGILEDFNNLSSDLYNTIIDSNKYSEKNKYIYSVYKEKYNLEKCIDELLCQLGKK